MPGYLSREYAQSLAEFGTPWHLPCCDGWLLERAIPGSDWRDVMSCYPRFCCRDWTALAADLDDLASSGNGPVSVSLVTDPFGNWNEELLRGCFADRLMPFKTHFVVDLSQPPAEVVSSHHRYYTRVASRSVRVEVVSEPTAFLDQWDALYAHLAERHGLSGIKRFSRAAFAQQLAVPGLVAFAALNDSGVVGGQLWYIAGDVAYSHLAAFSAAGYHANAGYALYSASLDYFAARVRWLDLGAGAGLDASGADGLTQFKRGWSNAVRQVYFCGRVLDSARYDELLRLKLQNPTNYFPAYRAGEFA